MMDSDKVKKRTNGSEHTVPLRRQEAVGRTSSGEPATEAVPTAKDWLSATSRLAVRIAHKINNPLAGIKNSFMLIKDAIPTGHQHYEYVGRVEKEIDRMAQVVRQMGDLYRPNLETRQMLRLTEIIGDVVALLKASSEEHGVEVAMTVKGEALPVQLAEGVFRQVLHNLLENAIDASHQGGTVWVEAEVYRERLWVQVTDEGTGIAPHAQDRLFEPLFTTKNNMTQSGFGLGLSMCKQLVDALGGSIDCVSELGRGSVFNLEIPLGQIGKAGV